MPEKTVYSAHPAMFRNHPIGFSVVSFFFLFGVLTAASGLASEEVDAVLAFFGVGVVISAIPALILLRWWLKALGTTLTVTNERVTLRLGLLSKHTSDVMLSDVRNVQVSQGVLQRMLGVGAVGVASAGHSGMEIEVGGIPDPQEVKRLIEEGRSAARNP